MRECPQRPDHIGAPWSTERVYRPGLPQPPLGCSRRVRSLGSLPGRAESNRPQNVTKRRTKTSAEDVRAKNHTFFRAAKGESSPRLFGLTPAPTGGAAGAVTSLVIRIVSNKSAFVVSTAWLSRIPASKKHRPPPNFPFNNGTDGSCFRGLRRKVRQRLRATTMARGGVGVG